MYHEIIYYEHDTHSEQEDDSEMKEEEIEINAKFFIEKDGTKLKN